MKKLGHFIKKIFEKFGIAILSLNTFVNMKKDETCFRRLAEIYSDTKLISLCESTGIIFSMDRALQLAALLESYYLNVYNPPSLHVLYKANTKEHEKAYEELIREFNDKDIIFVKQETNQPFKKQLLKIIESISKPNIFFLVDDIIFTRKFNLEKIRLDLRNNIFSLRLGKNIKFSYTMNQSQVIPELRESDKLLFWNWDFSPIGTDDWSYPFSVDGHFYLTREIEIMAENLEFTSPNTFEPAMYKFINIFSKRNGVSFNHSVLVNLPINKVQTDINNKNRSGNIDVGYLLEIGKRGEKIDIFKFQNIENISPHEELTVSFIKR